METSETTCNVYFTVQMCKKHLLAFALSTNADGRLCSYLTAKIKSIHFVSKSQHSGHFLKLLHGCGLPTFQQKAGCGFDSATHYLDHLIRVYVFTTQVPRLYREEHFHTPLYSQQPLGYTLTAKTEGIRLGLMS